jgi:hypothetical protein
MVSIIQRLHSDEAALQELVLRMLAEGMIVIVDISLISGMTGMQISGLLLKKIFDHNQWAFTGAESGVGTLSTIAVIEEAQSVLSRQAKDDSPFVQWVKEGRKYGLGSIMVTQQPGSLAPELLSQGDNFFTFHLLSAHDLKTLQTHNAHFSDDVLASLLNEPIKGNCYFWSAPDQPFVLPARILNFEKLAKIDLDEGVICKPVETEAGRFATDIRKAEQQLAQFVRAVLTDGRVEFYEVEANLRTDTQEVIACYKPRLAAAVAECLDDGMKSRFCIGNPNYVADSAIERALVESGIVARVHSIRARRPSTQKTGEYYLVPRDVPGSPVKCRETLVQPER